MGAILRWFDWVVAKKNDNGVFFLKKVEFMKRMQHHRTVSRFRVSPLKHEGSVRFKRYTLVIKQGAFLFGSSFPADMVAFV